jgi:hypothetical protein
MMVGPTGRAEAQDRVAIFEHNRWRHAPKAASLRGATALASAPTNPKKFGYARLRGKIIHLIVQNNAGSGRHDL